MERNKKKDEKIEKAEEAVEKEIEKEIEQRKDQNIIVDGWNPKTKIGRLVRANEMQDIDKLLENHKILEAGIVDSLLQTKSDLLAIGQSKGKFGGGKRRVWKQTQKKTMEGNVPSFACLAVVGDEKGHIGLGYGKSKETLPAREKAVRNAKINIMKIERGCGSFDCACKEPHSIPHKTEGKCSSVKLILIPAPQGTGLVVGDEVKKILRLAGIKDIYGKTFGQTRSTINLAKACMDALAKLRKSR